MNIKLGLALWSFRKELSYVLLAFLIVLSLPIVAVIILTNTGFNIVSDQLATVDKKTQAVEIRDPKDGSVIEEIHPVVSWPVKGVITHEFGEPHLPYYLFHSGIDIANPQRKIGDPVHPFMEGTVIYEGEIFWGFGKHIIIDHGHNITSVYGHLDKIFVYKGQKVKINDLIGNEGTTGWSTGPHLHFQINVFGIPVNPRTFLGKENPT
ncbi:MAG TPA: M23 family metallopeptidase [Candidatus Nitrosocosmicus sp.]|nr:M23 family metallopeptidase [Candidatus Nitrosocosmicus sp.]